MKPQFITDEQGTRTGVILSIEEFNELLDELDENHTAQLYDKAKAEELTFQPFSEVVTKIRAKRTAHLVSDSDQ